VGGILKQYYSRIRPDNYSAFQARVDPDLFLSLDLSRWPMSLRAKINGEKLSRNVGNRLATKIKQRLRKGLEADGRPIEPPVTGGKPLNRTGELIRSIRWDGGFVAPSYRRTRREKLNRAGNWRERTNRQTGKKERWFHAGKVRSNFALMIVLQTTGGEYTRRYRTKKRNGEPFAKRRMMDLMGADEPETRRIIEELTKRELQRQLDAGEAGLAAELRSIAARSRRMAAAAARRGG
jgi:hypothetical protein